MPARRLFGPRRPASSISFGFSAAPSTGSGCSTTERPPLPEADADERLSENGDKEDDDDGTRCVSHDVRPMCMLQ